MRTTSNIFFSVLIGFIIFFVPTTDYYTRHYLTATMIVWATTFSLLVLFVPKLHIFFSNSKKDRLDTRFNNGKHSDLTGREKYREYNENVTQAKQTALTENNSQVTISDDGNIDHLCKKNDNPMSLNYMANNSIQPLSDSTVLLKNISRTGQMHGFLLDVHEMETPIQQVFKYFPFLAAWEMMSVVLMPTISYFSIYSDKVKKGKVIAYKGATIKSCVPKQYVLKVHGQGMTNILMQVESEKILLCWYDWFNNKHSSQNTSIYGLNNTNNEPKEATTDVSNKDTVIEKQKAKISDYKEITGNYVDHNQPISQAPAEIASSTADLKNQRKKFEESGLTARHLLTEDACSNRRGSDTTIDSLDSCYYHPVLPLTEYNTSLSSHAHNLPHTGNQQEPQQTTAARTVSTDKPATTSITEPSFLSIPSHTNSNTADTKPRSSSFYSSLFEYLEEIAEEPSTMDQ
ncbi:hypothetical protein BDF20DRAFT_871929 [Mycotypha africana]|uniref:uncharacterized protein n=1 Tax=Mycotypha africana TaxID=64632 RepID=UPI002301B3CA|nr:uncharacterized protein BDF20DRAFT_871929 [Mycotypha africana]KAI8979829.1 hypothetical protein BDF20DRAFT_871929 [Mycotypha africana]